MVLKEQTHFNLKGFLTILEIVQSAEIIVGVGGILQVSCIISPYTSLLYL